MLEEYVWIRPSKETISVFDEIETNEIFITAQELPVYIRGLLNEYCRLPQYKREALLFDDELNIFDDACYSQCIIHFRDKETQERYKAFAFNYYYGYIYDQTNYCVIYDINNSTIKSIPLHRIIDIYMIKQKYKPSAKLIEKLQSVGDDFNFDEEIIVENN